ncbi:hypothetical protein OIO90_006353 [Microbotryomycetes sp. JL221]|nr:hypothetical protein OIO90_006353 [Microbotryomycetes sp. JL221]
MEAVRREATQDDGRQAPQTPVDAAEFDPLAVPEPYTFPGLDRRPSLNGAVSTGDDAQVDRAILLELGQEQLFSGYRTSASQQIPASDQCHDHEENGDAPRSNTTDLTTEQIGSLSSARAAFVSALAGLQGEQVHEQRAGACSYGHDHSEICTASYVFQTTLYGSRDKFRLTQPVASLVLASNQGNEHRLGFNTQTPEELASSSLSLTSGVPSRPQTVVKTATDSLSTLDNQLAQTLAQLLTCIDRLLDSAKLETVTPAGTCPTSAPSDPRQLTMDEQLQRLQQSTRDAGRRDALVGAARDVRAAERDLLWGRIDDLSEQVRALTWQRQEAANRGTLSEDETEQLPGTSREAQGKKSREYEPSVSSVELPLYSYDESEVAHPPAYQDDIESLRSNDIDNKTVYVQQDPYKTASEKMRRDLDSVSRAIERLYVVSPQLGNQRVEPDRRQMRERQLAKLGNAIERLSKGRLEDQRATPGLGDDEAEARARIRLRRIHNDALDHLVDQIDRAAARTLADQRVELKGKQRDVLNTLTIRNDFQPLSDAREAERREFILEHTGKGRLASQDAVLIRSSMTSVFPIKAASDDEETAISLQKFLESDIGPSAPARVDSPSKKRFSSIRSSWFQPLNVESSGAPSWGRRGSWDVRLARSEETIATARRGSYDSSMQGARRPGQSGSPTLGPAAELSKVQYIAEESCNLATVTVSFWQQSSSLAGSWQVASVQGDTIEIVQKDSGASAIRLVLPCCVLSQQAQITSQDALHQIKLATVDSSPTRSRDDLEITVPFPTSQMREHSPVDFECSICRRSLVHGTNINKFNSLPSEHWAELLDAWMCHQDQELADDLVAKGKGIRPRSGECLVGSSYFVFDHDVVKNWDRVPDGRAERSADNHVLLPIQCRGCQSMLGFEDVASGQEAKETGHSIRLLKFATHPISQNGRLAKHDLSVHITTEILELSQAHACHRFIISAFETERPRLYLWLFNPFVRIASNAAGFPIRQSSLQAVKVFYIVNENADVGTFEQLVGSDSLTHDRLTYPTNVVDKLTEALKASTSAYPKQQRLFGQFRVGFLERL